MLKLRPGPKWESFAHASRQRGDFASDDAMGDSVVSYASEIYAAIDLGTNKCRLLIARPAPFGFDVVESFSSMVWLGDGLSADNFLHHKAIERALAALRICAEKVAHYQPQAIRVVATAACRRAKNAEILRQRVAEEIGFAIEIISAEQEAMLALSGCSNLLDQAEPYGLLFDIGGGSTEILWLECAPSCLRRRGFISLPFGVANLLNYCGGGDSPLHPSQILTSFALMRDKIMAELSEFEQKHAIQSEVLCNSVQMLGCSSTVTTIIAKHLDLKRYDRARVDGQFISRKHVEQAIAHLLDDLCRDYGRASSTPFLRRRDFVLAGCAMIAAMMELWPVERLRVADRGVREGILLNLMGHIL